MEHSDSEKNSSRTSLELVPPSFGYWFAGFVDGEGCFTIPKLKQKNNTYYYKSVFSINQREDNRDVLYLIHDTLGGFGTLCTYNNDYNGKKRAKLISLSTGGKAQNLYLIDLLERYPLQGRKKQQFDLWKRAVMLSSSIQPKKNGRFIRRDWQNIIEIREKLMNLREYKEI